MFGESRHLSSIYEYQCFYLSDLYVAWFNYSMKYELIRISHLLQNSHTYCKWLILHHFIITYVRHKSNMECIGQKS